MLKKTLIYAINKKNIIPPKRPKSWECCGNSCRNCVWTIYLQDCERYKKDLKRKYKKNNAWGDTTIDME